MIAASRQQVKRACIDIADALCLTHPLLLASANRLHVPCHCKGHGPTESMKSLVRVHRPTIRRACIGIADASECATACHSSVNMCKGCCAKGFVLQPHSVPPQIECEAAEDAHFWAVALAISALCWRSCQMSDLKYRLVLPVAEADTVKGDGVTPWGIIRRHLNGPRFILHHNRMFKYAHKCSSSGSCKPGVSARDRQKQVR